MGGKDESRSIEVNRAPVLTLWAAVVAERMGFDRDEALTLGKGVAGLNAQSKGRRLGIYSPSKESPEEKRKRLGRGDTVKIDLLNRSVPARKTDEGLRALAKDRVTEPDSVERSLEKKFGDDLDDVRKAMETLAKAYDVDELQDQAYDLYSRFRPDIPGGKKGWGAKGPLNLQQIYGMASHGS